MSELPAELLEKIEGVAVLGPTDRLVIKLRAGTTPKEFEEFGARLGDTDGRILVVAGVEEMAVLRG